MNYPVLVEMGETWENVLIANNSSYVTGVSSSNGAYGLMYTYYTEVSLTNVDVSGNTWDGYDYLYGVLTRITYVPTLRMRRLASAVEVVFENPNTSFENGGYIYICLPW